MDELKKYLQEETTYPDLIEIANRAMVEIMCNLDTNKQDVKSIQNLFTCYNEMCNLLKPYAKDLGQII